MDLTSLKTKLADSGTERPAHLNIMASVEHANDEHPEYHIVRIPVNITADHIYESSAKDPKTGVAKKTPMAYVLPQGTGGAKDVVLPLRAGDATVNLRMGGFSLFVKSVA